MMLPWPTNDVIDERTAPCDKVYDLLNSSEDVTIQKNGETAIHDAAYDEAVGAFADLDTDEIDGFTVQYRRGTFAQRMQFQLPYEAKSPEHDIRITGTYNAASAN